MNRLLDWFRLLAALWRPAPKAPVPAPPTVAPPIPERAPSKIVTARLTYYYPIDADDPATWKDYKGAGDKTITIGDLGERTYPARFVACLRGEGQARTKDGMIAWDGSKFRLLSFASPWGIGAYENALIPYVSIAVDPKIIPLKSQVLCPMLKGKRMPNETVHDGILFAADTGGAIQGEHVDLFVRSAVEREHLETSLPAKVTLLIPA